MALDADKAWVLWPEYFDSSRSRSQGRRVPKELSIQNPQMENIIKAVDTLQLGHKMEEGKSYPAAWWNKQGLLLVENNMPKNELLIKVAQKLKKIQKN